MVEDTEEENATEQHGSTKVKISLIVNSNPVAFEFESGARRFRSELMQLRLQLPGLIGELSGEEEEAELYEEVHTVTADYQATVDDDLILADATADPLTVTLNYSIYAGQRVEIVKSDSGGNAKPSPTSGAPRNIFSSTGCPSRRRRKRIAKGKGQMVKGKSKERFSRCSPCALL